MLVQPGVKESRGPGPGPGKQGGTGDELGSELKEPVSFLAVYVEAQVIDLEPCAPFDEYPLIRLRSPEVSQQNLGYLTPSKSGRDEIPGAAAAAMPRA